MNATAILEFSKYVLSPAYPTARFNLPKEREPIRVCSSGELTGGGGGRQRGETHNGEEATEARVTRHGTSGQHSCHPQG